MGTVKVVISDIEGNREGFLRERQGVLGCSDLPAICGLSKWQSPLDVWMRLTGRVTPAEDNDVLWFGRSIEPTILGLLERREKVKTTRVNQMWKNTDYPEMICSPDALVVGEDGEEGLVEAKSAGIYQREQWGPDKAPDAAHLQLQGQLAISKRSWGYCAGLIGGNVRDFYAPKFKFEPQIWEQVYERVQNFFKLVKKDIPPDARAGDEKMLELLYGKPRELVIELPLEAADLIRRHEALQGERAASNRLSKKLGEEMDEIEVKLRQMLGSAEGGHINGKAVLMVLQTRKGYTVDPSEKWTMKIKTIER